MTERAHGGQDMGTDTEFGRPDFSAAGPDQTPVGRSKPPAAPRYGDRHEIWAPKPVGRPDMGTDTEFAPARPSSWPGGLEEAPVKRSQPAVAPRYGDRHYVRYTGQDQIWGQTRDFGPEPFGPVERTKRRSRGPSRPWHPEMGTDTMSDIPIRNVQRETFNSQLLAG